MSASDDIGGDHEGHSALVAEYVLGLLPAGQHERVGRLIEADAALRAERDFWVARFAVPLNTMRTWLRRSLIKLKDCLTA